MDQQVQSTKPDDVCMHNNMYSGNWLTRDPGCTEIWFLLKVFLAKSMKIVHSIYSWFTETVLVKQYFLLSDFVLTSFHCILIIVNYGNRYSIMPEHQN